MNESPDLNERPGTGHGDDEAPPAGIEMLRKPCAPQRDLWPGIEARLTPKARRRAWQQPLWLAAAGFAGVALLTAALLSQRPHREVEGQAAMALRAPAEVLAATRPSHEASLQLAATVRPVHPESRALVRANLKLVNNAEVQLRKAMQSDPDAAYLQSLLATAHQQKQSLQVALRDDGD